MSALHPRDIVSPARSDRDTGGASRPGPGTRRARRWAGQVGPPALLSAAIVLAWEWSVRAFGIPVYILPAPSTIAGLMVTERVALLAQAAVTLGEVLLGFVIAFILGAVLALLIFSSRTIERATVGPM